MLAGEFFLFGFPTNELIYDDMRYPAWSRVQSDGACSAWGISRIRLLTAGEYDPPAARKAVTEAWFRYFWYLGRR
jgi:hypothetical protein